MHARKLRPEEKYRSGLAMSVAFESGFDLKKEQEAAKEAKEEGGSDHWGAFSDDEKTMYGSLIMNLMDVNFDGHTVKMGGVGGVATLPPYRRSGAIRACMNASFRDLYDRGFVFSSLYPFSSAYYRKFGFEDGAAVQTWTLPIKDLNAPDVGGTMEQLFPGDDLSPLLSVYQRFYRDFNLSAARTAYDEGLVKENLLDQQRYIYLWRDETGDPRAFLILKRTGEDVMDCTTSFGLNNGLLFLDARALQALFFFVRTAFIANFRSIRFSVPASINIMSLVGEAASMECQWEVKRMLRALNAEQVLSLCKCKGKGVIKLKLEDGQLPENCGTFRLDFAPDRKNRVERTEEAPDVVLSIGDFSALICGVRTAEELDWMPGVRVENRSAPLESVFYRKHCHFQNLF